MDWRSLQISSCGTHHLDEHGQPAHDQRFDEVLKFHAPGLAPVLRNGQAWHIRWDGSAAYDRRFLRTFGYYEGLAAVVASEGWHHITADGRDAYARRHTWCGNFQQGRCAVRARDGGYFHIMPDGEEAYSDRWRYAGDYRDGIAVVQATDGYSTHIRLDGSFVHGKWFGDLDVFHKRFARARDEFGWTHVDHSGQPAYQRRFATVEPFYNGFARVERFDGGLEVVDERGCTTVELRPMRQLTEEPGGRVLARTAWGRVRRFDPPDNPPHVIKWTRGSCDREIEALLALRGHQGAPRLLGRRRYDMNDQLVLSLCDGELAGDPHPRRHEQREAIRVTREVLDVCVALHTAGWVHADIHPGNVLMGDPATLLDYACAIRATYSASWHGEINWGVWDYAPPEQLADFGELTPAADVYAAATLCVAMIRGAAPFKIPVKHHFGLGGWVAVRTAFAEARRMLDLADLSEGLRTALLPALSPEPAARPTARQLAEALSHV